MVVYILHLQTPLKHARHYVGFASRLDERIAHHRKGTGARMLQVCNEQGIDYEVARVFKGKDRTFERKLKRTKNARHYCPICMGDKVRKYQPGGSTHK